MLTTLPPYAARKVNLSKWRDAAGSGDVALVAAAVRSELTAASGVLSFWGCDGTPPSIDRVITAIASAHVRLVATDAIWVPVADLAAVTDGLTPTRGRTPYADLADSHLDVRISPSQTELIAALFLDSMHAGRYRHMPRGRVTRGIVDAVKAGAIALNDLSPGIQRRIIPLLEN